VYWVYLIKSAESGNYYIGQTGDLEKRIARHNSGQSRYTKNKGPWVLAGSIEVSTRSEAMRLEKKLKSYKKPEKVLEYFNSVNSDTKV